MCCRCSGLVSRLCPLSEAEFGWDLFGGDAVQGEAVDHLLANRADAAIEVDPCVDDFGEACVRLPLDAVAAWQRDNRRVERMVGAEGGVLADVAEANGGS